MLLNYRRLRQKPEAVELNITAFLALMVILVPFLLMTVVFTPHSVIETPLLQASQNAPQNTTQPLSITLRDNTITIQDFIGREQTIAAKGNAFDMPQLSQAMQRLKAEFPSETKAQLLVDKNVLYANTLTAMQLISGWRYRMNDRVKEYLLFPEITRGLAADASAAATAIESGPLNTEANL